MDIQNEFAKFETIARKWINLAIEDGNRGWNDYAGDYVRCYLANNSDHTAVQIGGFQISFFSSPKVEFTLRLLPTINEAVNKAIDLFDSEIRSREQISEEDKRRAAEEKRKYLLEQLAKLDAA